MHQDVAENAGRGHAHGVGDRDAALRHLLDRGARRDRLAPAFRRREVLAHRHEAQREGRPDEALAARHERHRALHPAAPDALLQQHRGDGGGGDVGAARRKGRAHEQPLNRIDCVRPARGRAARRGGAAQATNGIDSSTIQALPTIWPSEEIERAEGKPQEDDRDRPQGRPGWTAPRRRPAPARERRIDREIGEFGKQERDRRGDDQRGRREHAESTAPTRIASDGEPTPSRRCTRSRSTSAMPIISTPEGAISSGATGMRHGPFGAQTVPTFPIIQLASGMVRPNEQEKHDPLDPGASSRSSSSFGLPVTNSSSLQILRPATGRPGNRRSHSPSRGAASGRRDSSYGSPRPPDRGTLPRRYPPPARRSPALSIHISGVCSTKRRSMPRLSATCMALIVSSRQSG